MDNLKTSLLPETCIASTESPAHHTFFFTDAANQSRKRHLTPTLRLSKTQSDLTSSVHRWGASVASFPELGLVLGSHLGLLNQ
jgi:hypothetical protein